MTICKYNTNTIQHKLKFDNVYSIKNKKTRLMFNGHINISAIERLEAHKKREFGIVVRNAHHVHIRDKDGHKHHALHVDKEKTYVFRCKIEDDRDKWMIKINKSIDTSIKNVLIHLYKGSESRENTP